MIGDFGSRVERSDFYMVGTAPIPGSRISSEPKRANGLASMPQHSTKTSRGTTPAP